MLKRQRWRGGGRPTNGMPSYKGSRILEYLARIALKYSIDSNKLFKCIVDAWTRGQSGCTPLEITCREITNDSGIFLFTSSGKVIAQFPIQNAILRRKTQLKNYIKLLLADSSSNKIRKRENVKIGDLRAGMKKVSLTAKVLEIPKSKMVHTRYGTTAYVSNALITDETASMRMSLWNQQIGQVHEGDVIAINNSQVAWFNGERQLRLGRHGSLSVIEDAASRDERKVEVMYQK